MCCTSYILGTSHWDVVLSAVHHTNLEQSDVVLSAALHTDLVQTDVVLSVVRHTDLVLLIGMLCSMETWYSLI